MYITEFPALDDRTATQRLSHCSADTTIQLERRIELSCRTEISYRIESIRQTESSRNNKWINE